MAEGKKSFLLYTDIWYTVAKLDDETAGKLFKHLLAYVNDANPTTENLLIEVAFEPIKQQLKRDLNTRESIRMKRVEAGKLGGIKRQYKAKQANASKRKQSQANQAVNVNVNGNVNVNNKGDDFEQNPKETKKQFAPPTVAEVQEYCIERKNGLNPEQFVNFYEAKDRMIGKNRMKNWKAAIKTWETNRTIVNSRKTTLKTAEQIQAERDLLLKQMDDRVKKHQ